ncbi:hypothetical protein R5R35_010348 [Gryllus longicercus]|uniref:Uncharacterized protein n=1 Tax=Gryllus longicercus TaxID=2509291 RepID=A0AAN9WI65_9ORTH
MTLQHLRELVSPFSSVTPSDWERYCSHTHKLEEECWRKDGIMEMSNDAIIINTPSDSSKQFEDSSDYQESG